MKVEFFTKPFFLFAFILAFAVTDYPQNEKPQALELFTTKETHTFGEYVYSFAERLDSEPLTTKGFVQVIASAKDIEQIKSEFEVYSSSRGRILFEGKQSFRGFVKVTFFLVPQGADVPYWNDEIKPRLCPELTIGRKFIYDTTPEYLNFKVDLNGGIKTPVTYNWKVSKGEITEGQDASAVKIATKGAKRITATVEVIGLPDDCKREASTTFIIWK